MKKTKLFGWAFAATMMGASFTACTNEANEVLAQESEIRLTSEITPSRVTNLNLQSTEIYLGRNVGVTIKDAKSEHNNVPWSVSEDGALTNTSKPIYWGNKDNITITAYHPYNETWSEGTQEFSVSTNQGYDDPYLNSDLLYVKETVSRPTNDNPISLVFNHMLSKIIIKLQGDENLKSAKFYICGTNIDANLNLTEGKISEAETKNIKEIEAGYGTQVAAIIVPQSVKKNTIFVKIEQNDKIYYYTLPEDKTFAPGNKYEFLLTIKDATLITLKETIKDWTGVEENNSEGDAEMEVVLAKNVTIEKAGTLSTLIPVNEQKTITSLTVSGPINGTDIAFIRTLIPQSGNNETLCLYDLDLSNASIVAGGEPYNSSYTTQDNVIGKQMFQNLKLESLILPSNITEIEDYAFSGCTKLKTIDLPNTITKLGGLIFSGSGVQSITIPKSLSTFYFHTFFGAFAISSMVVDEENPIYESRNDAIFYKSNNVLIRGCKNTIIPDGTTAIGPNAFTLSALTSITIPNSVTSIEDMAFETTELTSITIPNSVTNIGGGAFSGCLNLNTVVCEAETPPTLGQDAFGLPSSNTMLKIYVPSTAVNVYKAATGWSSYADYIVANQ